MIVEDRLLQSVLVLLSIYVFLFSVFSNIAPVWTTKAVADQPCMTMYTGQFLRQLQGASNCRLNYPAWRAACTAGLAHRRPTHRGCRGGVRKQRHTQVKQMGVNNANLKLQESTITKFGETFREIFNVSGKGNMGVTVTHMSEPTSTQTLTEQ